MPNELKPPLGVSPHWFVHRKRIGELNEAIGRFLEHIDKIQNIQYTNQCYEAIAGWAREIEILASFEAERNGK